MKKLNLFAVTVILALVPFLQSCLDDDDAVYSDSQLPLSDNLMTRMIIISVWTVAERCIRAMTPLSVIIRL